MLQQDRKNKIKQIAKHYGLEQQELIAIEECSELIKAICKLQRDPYSSDYHDNVVEEIADVQIMLHQLIYLYGIENQVNIMIDRKIDRQLRRIEEER